ncbi:TonB-dependent receptor [Kordiimonas marina]|uniref:TonB-dependent receptor n=1 Tax=Kordiimonas marina TaxID=2872312 RepID=UPI001FF1D489|nr:TonB-dependent receptor [Kordiimonas marina]MCJ9427983.1 TonB-dependent receptor [Kordiimonas marina]
MIMPVGAAYAAADGAAVKAGDAKKPGTEVALEEIVVTATKRAVSLQDTAMSISALTGKTLDNMGADNFVDYARSLPSVSFVDRGPSRKKIVIRGISSGVNAETQTTGVYFDEVPVGAASRNPDLKIFDIERIEVLRGPQGTLYGEGSMGGTIRIITNKPDLENFAADVQGTYSSTHKGGSNYALNGMVNIPIVNDKLAVRAVGYYRNFDGYVDNVTLGLNNVNKEETWGGRFAARLKASDSLMLTFNIIHQDSKYDAIGHYDPAIGDLKQNQKYLEYTNDKFTAYNLTLDLDLGWANLNSSTSYFDRQFANLRDLSPLLGGIPAYLENTEPDTSWVHETRLVSQNDGRFQWIAGVFYKDGKGTFNQLAEAAFFPGLSTDPLTLVEASIPTTTRQVALFGEASYDLTDKLKATVGLRWFDIKVEDSSYTSGLLVGPATTVNTSVAENGVTPKFLLSYQASKDFMLYTTAAKGFRQGGTTGQGNPPDPDTGEPSPTSYDSDSLWSYEVGAKSTLLDGRMTLNLAAFYVDWSNIQVTVLRSDGFSFTANAGKASSKGVEAEMTLRPMEGLDISLSGSYTNAQLEEDQPLPGDGKKGDNIPGVPDVNLAALARYSFALTDSVDAFVQGSVQHVGASRNGFATATGTGGVAAADAQPAYTMGNVRAGVMMGNYEIDLFVDNLWDERPVNLFNRFMGDVRIQTSRPRTFGVSVKTRF